LDYKFKLPVRDVAVIEASGYAAIKTVVAAIEAKQRESRKLKSAA
jgi:hypothetical protein